MSTIKIVDGDNLGKLLSQLHDIVRISRDKRPTFRLDLELEDPDGGNVMHRVSVHVLVDYVGAVPGYDHFGSKEEQWYIAGQMRWISMGNSAETAARRILTDVMDETDMFVAMYNTCRRTGNLQPGTMAPAPMMP